MRPQAPVPPHDSGVAARRRHADGIDRVMTSRKASLDQAILAPDDILRNYCTIGQSVLISIRPLRQVYANQTAHACRSLGELPLAMEVVQRHHSSYGNRPDA